MAEQATSFVDRFDTARERIDEEVSRVQKEIRTRRKRIEKQIATGRRNIEKQTRRQVKELQKNSVVQQLERARDEATRTVEGALEAVLGVLQIASKGDVDRIDRKLTKLNKKLKDIERARKGNGQAPGPVAQV